MDRGNPQGVGAGESRKAVITIPIRHHEKTSTKRRTAGNPRETIAIWRELLSRRKVDNGGYTVQTDRGNEKTFTILATGWDLDDLDVLLELIAAKGEKP